MGHVKGAGDAATGDDQHAKAVEMEKEAKTHGREVQGTEGQAGEREAGARGEGIPESLEMRHAQGRGGSQGEDAEKSHSRDGGRREEIAGIRAANAKYQEAGGEVHGAEDNSGAGGFSNLLAFNTYILNKNDHT